MTETLRKSSNNSTFVANAAIAIELRQFAFSTLGLYCFGQYNTTSTNTLTATADTAPWPIFGRVTAHQGGSPIIASVEPKLLAHLDAIYRGSAAPRLAQTVDEGVFSAQMCLDFHRMLPGAGIDATATPLQIITAWKTYDMYGTTSSGITAITATTTFGANGYTAELVPQGGFLRPRIWQSDFDLSAAGTAKDCTIAIDHKCLCTGVLISAEDASGKSGMGDLYAGVDGLVRNVTIALNEPGGETQYLVSNVPWQVLRDYTARRSGFTAADITDTVGRIFVPFTEKRTGARLPVEIAAGSTLTITVDTSSTCSLEYTAVTPASGDMLKVVPVTFTRQEQAGGATEGVSTASLAKQGGFRGRRLR